MTEVEIPQSLRLIIGRRLAHLSAPTKQVLGPAAVIGRSFAFELLEASTRIDAESLLDYVEEAERAGLITASTEQGETRFQFAHELVRQAVIANLSAPRLQRIHLEIASAIERMSTAGIETHVNDLAHHLWHAGTAARPERTIECLVLAAKQACGQSAYEAGLSHFGRALQIIKKVAESTDRDRQEFEIYLEYLAVLSLTNRFTRAEVAVAHSRAQELCERLGEASRMYVVLQGSAGFHLRRGEYKKLHDCATRILELSDNAANPTWAVSAHYLIGHSLCCLGDLVTAHEHLDLASTLVGPTPIPDIVTNTAKVCALAVDALTLWTWGYPDRAKVRLDELLIFAEATKNPFDLAIALIYAHIVTLFRREFAQALSYADQGLRVASEKQFQWLETSLGWSRDACRILAGASCDITKSQAAFEVYFGSEAKLYKPDNCTVLAECCGCSWAARSWTSDDLRSILSDERKRRKAM